MKKLLIFVFYLTVTGIQFFLIILGWREALQCLRTSAFPIVREIFDPQLWNSAGVFIGLISIMFPLFLELLGVRFLQRRNTNNITNQ